MRQIIYFLIISVFFYKQVSAQWQKVEAVTSPYVYSALFTGYDIYIGGDSLYISRDKGLTWNSSAPAGQPVVKYL